MVHFKGLLQCTFGERQREDNNGTPRDILGMCFSQIGAVL